jgi:hypothetical protein
MRQAIRKPPPSSGRVFDTTYRKLEEVEKMATQLCQKCKQAHPGRVCDYDEKGECAETIDTNEVTPRSDPPSKEQLGTRSEN